MKIYPFSLAAISFFAVIALAPIEIYADGVPGWLQQAAAQQTPPFEMKKVPAVVLLNEESVVVGSDGTVITTHRYAVRVLEREGVREAVASVVYETDSEKVRDISAW